MTEKLHAILYQKQTGAYVAPQKLLLQDWLEQWIHNYAEVTVRPSTYISYEGYIYNHINPSLGNLPIQQITPVIIQNFYNQKFASGRTDGKGGLSSKTIRNLHNMFHQAMEQAKINGLILNNPTDNAIIPKQEKREMRVLSVEEEKRLIQVVPQHRLGFAIFFDLATGLRIGELCALKWSDINYSRQTIKISRTLQRIKKSMNEKSMGRIPQAFWKAVSKPTAASGKSRFRRLSLPCCSSIRTTNNRKRTCMAQLIKTMVICLPCRLAPV